MASNWLFLWVSVYIKKAFNSFKGSWRKTARHVFTWRNLHVPKFRFDMKVNYSVQANSHRDISNLALHICLLLLFLLLVPLYFVWNPTLVPSPCAPRQWSMLKHKAWEWSWQNGTIAFREDNQVIFFFFWHSARWFRCRPVVLALCLFWFLRPLWLTWKQAYLCQCMSPYPQVNTEEQGCSGCSDVWVRLSLNNSVHSGGKCQYLGPRA